MMIDINWPFPSSGENSTDDPHELSQKYATNLVNIRPDGVVRGGMEVVNVPPVPNLSWTFLYDEPVNPTILMKSGADLMAYSDNRVWMIAANLFSDTDAVSAERIGDAVVIVTDNPVTGNHLLTRESNQFVVTPTTLARPSPNSSGELIQQRYVNGTATITEDMSWRTYAFTWIKREPINPLAPGFVECQLESEDDLTVRMVAFNKGFGTGVGIKFNEIPSGATHVRLYRTIGTKGTIPNWSEIEAGSELLWLVDIPVTDAVYEDAGSNDAFGNYPAGYWIKYADNATDGEMAGETNKLWTMGKNSIPTGRHVKYHNNRLWVGGRDGYNPGRWYYSEPIRSANPLKWLLMFDYAANFVDTSVDDTEYSMGAAVSRGDLIFFMDKNVWRLPAGDPENYAPINIGVGFGTLYPNSICEYNQLAYYLSVRGPAVVGGPEVSLVKEFAISDLWPNSFNGVGAFFQPGMYGAQRFREKIRGFWHDDNWILSDGTTTGCLYAPSSDIMGPWRMTTNGLKIVMFQPVGNFMYGWSEDGTMHKMFSKTNRLDGLIPFAVKIGHIPKNMDRTDSSRMGSPYFAAINARWMDSGEMRTVLRMDNVRMYGSYRYEEVRNNTPVYGVVMPTVGPKWESQRMVVQQCFREGEIGTWIQPQIEKNINSRFEYRGITIRIRMMNGRLPEYVSVSEEVPLSPLDSGIAVFEFQGN